MLSDVNFATSSEYIPEVRVSEITGNVILDLLGKGSCGLARFDTARVIHESMISSLTSHFKEAGIDGCPIT